jgi:hypothetical protein
MADSSFGDGTMNACPLKKTDWVAYLSGDLEDGRRTTVAEHLKECPECRKDVEEIRRVLEGADAVKGEIQEALRSVDWEALPSRVADYVFANAQKPEKVPLGERIRMGFLRPSLRPVLAGLVLGVVLGSAGMYLALRNPAPAPDQAKNYHASQEFLDRAELEMARRETVDYLEKSEYVLLDFFGTASGQASVRTASNVAQARELLSKKKYLNREFDKFQMAKAKTICDQIEMLFLELAQISGELPEAELAKIRDLVQDRQLLLKISLVKKELQNGV